MRGWGRILGAVAALAVALAGCSAGNAGVPAASGGTNSGPAGAPSPGSRGAGEARCGTRTGVGETAWAATCDQLRTRFLAAPPWVHFPEIPYDGSSTLVTPLRNGAPADFFASADEANMDKVAELVASRADFATNTLQIAVAPGNPKDITSLADLAKPGVVTVICEAPVPCGAASHRSLDAAGVTLTPASEEQNVAAVLTKVATGDADAGLVYATDVKSSGGKVQGIDFPQAARAVNIYPIAVLKDSGNAAAARAFVDLVTGTEGLAVLAAAGFGPP
jgi:molybdate transport system substrate-binding protein